MAINSNPIEKCAGLIEDQVICDLMNFCAKRYDIAQYNGEVHCDELRFSFYFPFKGRKTHVTIQREGNRLIYSALLGGLKRISEIDIDKLVDYLDGIGSTERWIPGIRRYDQNQDSIVFSARHDTGLDDTNPKNNQSDFVEILVNLKRFLGKIDKNNPNVF